MFKKNITHLPQEIGDTITNGDTSRDLRNVREALNLSTKTRPIMCQDGNTDEFTEFINSMQPPEHTPRVYTFKLSLPPRLESQISKAIKEGQQKRAHGPDKIRLEMLRLQAELFTRTTMGLWGMVGRLGFVPSLLRSSILSLVYKQEADLTTPSNIRPICLISVFRKLVSSTIMAEIERVYQPSNLQWRDRKGEGTEHAVIYGAKNIRRTLPEGALLDRIRA